MTSDGRAWSQPGTGHVVWRTGVCRSEGKAEVLEAPPPLYLWSSNSQVRGLRPAGDTD